MQYFFKLSSRSLFLSSKNNFLKAFKQKSCFLQCYNSFASLATESEKDVASVRVMSLLQAGEAFLNVYKYGECQKRYEEALNISENDIGPNSRELGLSLNCLAQLHHLKGNLFEALDLYNRSRAALSEDFKQNRMLLAGIENNMSVVYQSFQDYDAGVKHLQKSADMLRLDVKHELDQKIDIISRIGAIRMSQGNFEEAKSSFLKVIDFIEANPQSSIPYNNLGKIQLELADIFEKEGDLKNAFTYRQKAINLLGGHPGCSTLLSPIYESMVNYCNPESEDIFVYLNGWIDALKTSPKPADHAKVPRALTKKGHVYFLRNDFENAKQAYIDAMNYEKTSPDAVCTFSELLSLHSSLAKCFENLGKDKEAIDCLNNGVGMHENSTQGESLEIAEIYESLGKIHQKLSKKSKALKYYKKSLKFYKKLGSSYKQNFDALQSTIENYGSEK